jgi:hypothetical protein
VATVHSPLRLPVELLRTPPPTLTKVLYVLSNRAFFALIY